MGKDALPWLRKTAVQPPGHSSQLGPVSRAYVVRARHHFRVRRGLRLGDHQVEPPCRQPDFGVDPGKVGGPRRLTDAACLQRRGSTAASEKTQQHDTRREWKRSEEQTSELPSLM